MKLIEVAKSYAGFQETAGANRGPNVDRWKGMVSQGLTAAPIPWCGCFLFGILCEVNSLDRKGLVKALGFDPKNFWPESADSWLAQFLATKRVTLTPTLGDAFFLMRKTKTGFSACDAYHIGIVGQQSVTVGKPFVTVEGNTVGGTDEGRNSHEGTSVAVRSRVYRPGAVLFGSIPDALKGSGVL